MTTIKNAASSILVTCSLCLVAVLLITLCYQATEERIADNGLRKEEALRLALLPDADGFTLAEDLEEPVQGVLSVYTADNKTGWVVTARAKGYQGWVTVMTGIDKNGRITNVRVTDVSEESAGIGTKLTRQDYLDQYKGASSISSYKGRPNAAYIEAVSGATYTSEAVFSCVSLSFMQVQELQAKEMEGALHE